MFNSHIIFVFPIFIFIFSFVINALNQQKIYTANYKVAFNTNIIYIKKFKKNKIKILKINIERCNQNLLNKILIFHFKSHMKYSKDTPSYGLKTIIRTLTKSGFLNYIEIFDSFYLNSKYIILNLKINPLLKKIIILEHNKLYISKNILINLFQQQLGIPKNYYFLNKSLNKIYSWYRSRGFLWVKIQLNHSFWQKHNISLKIFEGKIYKNIFICKDRTLFKEYIINDLIKSELNINPGKILNIYSLEKGIIKLKKNNILQKCNYYVNVDKQGLILTIEYTLTKAGKIYLYNNNSNLIYPQNYLSILKLITDSNTTSNKIFLSFFQICIKKFQVIFFIFPLNNFLIFYYESLYNKKFTHHFITKIQASSHAYKIDFLISNCFVSTKQQILFNLIIKNCYYYFKSYIYNKDIAMNLFCFSQQNRKMSNLYTKLYNIYLKSHKSFYNNSNINEYLHIIKKIKSKIYLNLRDKNYTDILLSDQKSHSFNKIYKIIQNQWINFQIFLDIKSHHFYKIFIIKQDLRINSILHIFFQRKKFYKLNYILDLIQYINYTLKFIAPAKIIFPLKNKQTLTLLTAINLSIGQPKCLLNHQNSLIEKINKYLKYYYFPKVIISSFYLFSIKYKIYLHKYLSIYIFFDLINYLSYQSRYLDKIKLYKYSYNNLFIVGLGLKLNIPIQNTPNIYLKFSLRNNQRLFILYTSYKYNK